MVLHLLDYISVEYPQFVKAGKFPTDPLATSGIPALGIYPSVQGLALQTLPVVVIVASFLYARVDDRRGLSS